MCTLLNPPPPPGEGRVRHQRNIQVGVGDNLGHKSNRPDTRSHTPVRFDHRLIVSKEIRIITRALSLNMYDTINVLLFFFN